MSQVDDAQDGEFETAIAAAAYAITLLDEESSLNQKKSVEESRSAFTKTMSKREESMNKPTDTSKTSRWLSGKEEKDGKSPGESSLKKSGSLDLKDSAANHKVAEKETQTTPTIKKTPTSSDRYLNDTGSKRFGHRQDQGGQQEPSMIKSRPSFSGKGNGGWKTANSNTAETKADAWERAKMAKIKMRFEKANATILEWENEKKAKARRRFDRNERESERRRARASQEYHNELSRIEKIVGTAKALEEERKRNDEYKTMEKARKIRLTGKVPGACPCL
ncbi:remorin 4.2 [Cocos nucifera]|uniref:Remorin 4.2 n=1 Tax=Cocos nucifera TaxID=13894 RepID=A0A8K0I7K7_COCNU|nr:remorin 4.2 [Cocos nucifera]